MQIGDEIIANAVLLPSGNLGVETAGGQIADDLRRLTAICIFP